MMNSERQAKVAVVKEISKKITDAKTLIIAEYAGLSVKDLQNLKKELKPSNVEVKVYKNRLFKIAAKKIKLDFTNTLSGPNIYVFGMEDEIAPIKILVNFAKKNDLLKLKVGTYEGRIIDTAELYEVAALPSYEEALIILANSMMGSLKMLSVGLNMLSTDKK